ncbi:hypothetical protein J2S43_001118 [Catenuloplanes nepalensis]|uniref:Uncharacterized protein n=1 Tax=Catenuloplanes nepalensis TaxID=587533 RepID=A0ABT9MNH0_9ACTN|nr:hypothetical protein [Catenuloplanes nepalensis]MDP9792606.1 hypothetical protein [Catenuloplanes nepalensis]
MASHVAPQQRDLGSAGTGDPAARATSPHRQSAPDGAHAAGPQQAAAAVGDLAHLDPERLRIGGAGVFAGDWAWTDNGDGRPRIPVGFAGVFIDTWNGWAVFSCTRQVAEAIVADQSRMRDRERAHFAALGRTGDDLRHAVDEACPPMWFDGEDLVVDSSAAYDEPAIERCSPDPEGRYVVMGWSWCWTAVAPTDCDRIVGELPAAGQHQLYVELVHTSGMRMPHDRLTATVLSRATTASGMAFTADLVLDGAIVGSVKNLGNGGATNVSLHTTALDRDGLHEFVRACRRHGRPVTETAVIAALVTENYLTVAIAAARGRDGVLVRLLDDAGDIVEVVAVFGVPRDLGFRAALRDRVSTYPVRRGGGIAWQVWSHRGWQYLTRARNGGAQP